MLVLGVDTKAVPVIPIETVEEIRQRNDLVEVAAEYVPLRKRGVNFLERDGAGLRLATQAVGCADSLAGFHSAAGQ